MEDLQWALRRLAGNRALDGHLEFPDFEQDYEFVALRHPDEYPFNEGRLVSNRGLDIDAAEYEDHFVEQHVKHSNALHSVVRGRGSYLVGPHGALQPELRQTARSGAASRLEKLRLRPPVKNPFRSIIVRAVELVFACAEALRIIRNMSRPPRRGSKCRTARALVRPSPKRRAASSTTATPSMKRV